MKKILVTGGAGFIGSNLVAHLLRTHADYHVVNLDALTYAGNLENLNDVTGDAELAKRYTFIHGDITDRALVQKVFADHDIKGVFHLAAESHVDNSIDGPAVFMHTNLIGTFNVVDAAYRHWMDGPNQVKPGYETCRFHHTSTDEVYGTLGETGLFSETTPYAPNPPYAASKAGADFIVRSYNRTFGLNATISNCSNNYGPHQHAEKLIPTIVRKAIAGQPIPIYGDGKNIRDWLYVVDHCKALDLIHQTGRAGETYNIGCDNEQDNNAMAKMICEMLDDIHPAGAPHAKLISYVKDRAGHDRRYAIDATKITTELKWAPEKEFLPALRETIRWFANKFSQQKAAA